MIVFLHAEMASICLAAVPKTLRAEVNYAYRTMIGSYRGWMNQNYENMRIHQSQNPYIINCRMYFATGSCNSFHFSPADVHGWDPFKIGKASKHVHLAISELNATVIKLPDQLKDTIGSNIKLFSSDMDQVVSKIDNQTAACTWSTGNRPV